MTSPFPRAHALLSLVKPTGLEPPPTVLNLGGSIVLFARGVPMMVYNGVDIAYPDLPKSVTWRPDEDEGKYDPDLPWITPGIMSLINDFHARHPGAALLRLPSSEFDWFLASTLITPLRGLLRQPKES